MIRSYLPNAYCLLPHNSSLRFHLHFVLLVEGCFGWQCKPLSLHHPHQHSAEVRNKPDQPHNETIPVELFTQFFNTFSDDPGCPCCMYKHEPECNLSGESMQVKQVKRLFCKAGHCQSSCDIEYEAGPECSNMPPLEVS
jgi:hypothetical protein